MLTCSINTSFSSSAHSRWVKHIDHMAWEMACKGVDLTTVSQMCGIDHNSLVLVMGITRCLLRSAVWIVRMFWQHYAVHLQLHCACFVVTCWNSGGQQRVLVYVPSWVKMLLQAWCCHPQEGTDVVMVQEYAEGGDLYRLLHKNGGR